MKKVQAISGKLINFFFIPMILISLVGAVSLLPSIIQGTSYKFIGVLTICLFIGWIVVQLKKEMFGSNTIGKISGFAVNYKKWILFIFSIVIIVWQISLIYYLSGLSIWDPGIVSLAASNNEYWVKDYFSVNPNNLSLLFLEHIIWIVFRHPSIYKFITILNGLNLAMIDVATCLIVLIVKNFIRRKSVVYFVKVSVSVLMILSPWLTIMYTDTIGFFLTSVNMLLS